MNSALIGELESKRAALSALCERFGVARLELFGSGATEEWRAGESDLDFVVVFRASAGPGLADRYLGLADALENLFGRPVDLLTEAGIQNPYFRRAVDATRSLVYAE